MTRHCSYGRAGEVSIWADGSDLIRLIRAHAGILLSRSLPLPLPPLARLNNSFAHVIETSHETKLTTCKLASGVGEGEGEGECDPDRT
jgi:hypothetical protein